MSRFSYQKSKETSEGKCIFSLKDLPCNGFIWRDVEFSVIMGTAMD
jgi:hypothetical protein